VNRIKVAPTYDNCWLETERPQPLVDLRIEQLQQDVLNGKLDKDITDAVYTNFKSEVSNWLFASKLNNLTGFDSFNRVDIINGCTQFIDNIYMQSQPQILVGDYRYHDRLGNWGTHPGLLREDVPLIIAMPFPNTGDVHVNMQEILDEAQDKGISVHVDGAWLTCCRGIDFALSHPSIKSVAISLSKGLGLGWNRVGLRWTRDNNADAVTIMNDFNMNLRAPAMIGLHFVRNLPPDYLWNTYGDIYHKVCRDFYLTPTKSIYLALKNGQPVGLSPLIRHVAQYQQ
jgi:hypothetical protein